MIKLKKTNTFSAEVKVSIPTDDPRRPNEGSFVAKFERIAPSAFAEIQRELESLFRRLSQSMQPGEAFDDEDQASTADLIALRQRVLDRHLLGVEGIADENGKEFQPEEQLATVKGDLLFLNPTFDKFIATYSNAPTKNSRPSRRH